MLSTLYPKSIFFIICTPLHSRYLLSPFVPPLVQPPTLRFSSCLHRLCVARLRDHIRIEHRPVPGAQLPREKPTRRHHQIAGSAYQGNTLQRVITGNGKGTDQLDGETFSTWKKASSKLLKLSGQSPFAYPNLPFWQG